MSVSKSFPESVIPGDLICPGFDVKTEKGQDVVVRFVPGNGCILQSFDISGQSIKAIVATLKGQVHTKEKIPESSGEEDGETLSKPTSAGLRAENSGAADASDTRVVKEILVSVSSSSKLHSEFSDDQFINNLPQEGDIVLARVTRINLQRITVEILAVETSPLPIDSGVGSNGSGVVAATGGSGAATFSVSQASADLGETFRGIIRSQDVRATDRDRVKVMESFKPGDIIRAQILSLGDGTHYYLTTARNDLGVVFAKSFNGAGEQMYAIDWQTMISPSTGVVEKRKCAKPF